MRSTSALSGLLLVSCLVACGTADSDDARAAPASNSPGDELSSGRKGSSNASGDDGKAPGPRGSSSDDGTPAIPYVPFDINHVLETGQSNSVANNAFPIESTEQPYANIMFDTGVIPAASCDGNGCTSYEKPTAFVPLVEGDRYFTSDGSSGRETISSGLANQASFLAEGLGKASHVVLTSLHGRSGNAYYCLRKGGCGWWPSMPYVRPFEDGMRQVDDAMAIAAGMGKSYVVRAVTTIHGETDHYSNHFPHEGSDGTPGKIANYADALVEWQADYESEIKARTGQTIDVPLLVSQMHDWNNVPDSDIPLRQYEAHLRAPRKVVLVAPTYMLPFQKDCLHFTASSERRLGEYFAKAYARIVIEGRAWEPVHPKAVTRAGNVITVKYHVPAPPLVLDTSAVVDPGNYGFEFRDELGTAVSAVEVTSADTVTVTLSGEPGASGLLRYAATATPSTCPGPTRGPRGNLRDSDKPSRTGNDLANWGVSFQIAVP